MYRNHYEFKISDANGNVKHEKLSFHGIDSETAHTTCIKWANSRYKCECTAELTDGGRIETNNERRVYQFLTQPKVKQEVKIFRVLKKAKVES